MFYSHLHINQEQLPLQIHNNYLVKIEYIIRIILMIFFIWGINFNLVVQEDALNELYRKMALATFIFGVLWIFIGYGKMLIALLKNKLFITIDEEKILYEYITDKGEKKFHTLFYNQIEKVSWSFYSYSLMADEIWITDIIDRDKKHWTWLGFIISIGASLILLCLYIMLNFKIERYVLLKHKNGILAIPVRNGISTKNIKFEWNSLINRHIIDGGYYGK